MADIRTLTVKRNRRVKVFVRTRPTPYFAHEKLEILPENKVSRDAIKRDVELEYIRACTSFSLSAYIAREMKSRVTLIIKCWVRWCILRRHSRVVFKTGISRWMEYCTTPVRMTLTIQLQEMQ